VRQGEKTFLFGKSFEFVRQSGAVKTSLSADEIRVLKKLDNVRYNDRSKDKMKGLLTEEEKNLLDGLIKKGVVSLFSNAAKSEQLYSISKDVYDKFLMRKAVKKEAAPEVPVPHEFHVMSQNEYVNMLEKNGFVVLSNEADASVVSSELEESIRRGLVLGTRAFNKKFYIVLRSFFIEKSPGVVAAIRKGTKRVKEIAEQLNIDEDAVRSILYVLAESGDVTERRKDMFELA